MTRSRLAGASALIAGAIALTSLGVVGVSLIAPAPPATVLAAGAGGAVVAEFPVSADYCYVEAMIPHHEQALELSGIVLDEPSAGERVRALAEFIVTDQTREIEAMEAWRDAWTAADRTPPEAAAPAAGGHDGHAAHGSAAAPAAPPTPTIQAAEGCEAHGGAAGHGGMQGMATPAQLDALRSSDGVAAERMFLELMIVHHEGALVMARTAVAEGENAFTRASAKHVLIEQAREIAAMGAIIEELG
ncbi:DUF305 domain-containing protein [Agromyces subbeticus]|uniref:DUF305 domain-containing protein n=1 Tax=Agromyces subbeticus TaxID=293890 RepID=UPI0003B3BAEB|nr:DUF305 domain-containing protein [Agromyces subbeticus]